MNNTSKAPTQQILSPMNDAQLDALAEKLANRLADGLAERVFQKLVSRQEAAHPQQVEAEQAQALQAAEFQKSLEQIYARYPFLSDANPEANPTAIQEALDLTNVLKASGVSVADAVWQAAAKVGPKYETRPVH